MEVRKYIQMKLKFRIIFSRFHPCIYLCIQLFRERLSGKVHATVLKGIVGGFEFSFFQRNLKELVRKAMEMCLRVLKESNRSRFDSYSRQEQCIDHIPYYLSGLSRALFPTTFLEIAVYIHIQGTYVNLFILKVMTEAPYCLMGKQIKSAFTLIIETS